MKKVIECPQLVYLVAGARPNFMKIAPLYHALLKASKDFRPAIVHTGQHYGKAMSDFFFRDLGLPRPHYSLDVGSGSHAEQTAAVMTRFEELCLRKRPDWIVVVGDVNSTMAAALVGTKLHIPVAHVEAGLRSRDRSMPEEINRIVTDSICDLLLTPSPDGDRNLMAESVPRSKIVRVGNIMIDSLKKSLPKARAQRTPERLGLKKRGYAVLTLHRPANVDSEDAFLEILKALEKIQKDLPILFPAHPRTQKQMAKFPRVKAVLRRMVNFRIIDPLGYLEFLDLVAGSALVLTDSGGLQEETSHLRIPCITIRSNTERPVTVTHGTNILAGTKAPGILKAYRSVRNRKRKKPIPLWDGKTADRIVRALRTATRESK